VRGHGRTWFAAGFVSGCGGRGHSRLVDFDVVDYTNLQRQVLHFTSDVGRLKIDSAIDKLTAINPFVGSSASIRISTARMRWRSSAALTSSPMHG